MPAPGTSAHDARYGTKNPGREPQNGFGAISEALAFINAAGGLAAAKKALVTLEQIRDAVR